MLPTQPTQPTVSSAEVLAPGECVAGRYEIEATEAVGGMSVIYRARDRETGLPIAIKVLHGGDAVTQQRFAAEAAILSTLSHPGVVRFIAHGAIDARAQFLAMEWLSGEDLSKRLSRAGLRASECLAVMRQVCAGLSAVHEHGILHRDIKPSNVFLVGGSLDRVKLLDFGVARQGATTQLLTQAGSFVGTVGYMSPEQVRGDCSLDPSSDVFSLGALLFECLTGRPAFAGAHDLAVLSKVLREEPAPVSSLRPDLGPQFDALFDRLLAKERAERAPTVREALELIESTYARGSFDAGVVAPASRERESFAGQRILSVVALRSRAEPGSEAPVASPEARAIDALARELELEVFSLQGKAWLLLQSAGSHSAVTDQAGHAARCALRLVGGLRLSIAVATGAVDTAARVPSGIAIERALELSAEDSDAIKLDELTARLLGPRFRIQKTARSLVLGGEAEEGVPGEVLMGKSTPFVGRTTEIALLEARLRECVSDEVVHALLVVGPAGAGKSRLSREFVERAKLTGAARILVARSDPTTASSPLGLAQRLIRGAAGLRAGASIDAQRGALESYLREALGSAADDQLVDFMSEIVGVGAAIPERALHRAARSDPEVMREQKRRAFERWVSATLARGPLLLLLEDVHWGDLPSLGYMRHVIRVLSHAPLFVLATSRPGHDAKIAHLSEQGVFQEVALRALTRKASERLVRAMLPVMTPDPVVTKVVSLASGNAFYLEELVRRVAEDGTTELPESVVAMAQSRIERLPQDARQILCTASVFGETVWAGGIDLGLASAAESATTLEWLVEEEILKLSADARFPGEREFTFRHTLLREAAYAMLTDTERRREHLRVAECLERWGERDARVLADHFERGGAIARALPWVSRAAMSALNSGDFENAIALARRGTSLGAYGDQRGQLLLVGAYAATWTGHQELPDEALSLLPRATAPWWLALSLGVYGSNVLGVPERAEPYLQLALTTLPDTEPTGAHAQAVQVLAAGAALVGRPSVGWALVKHFESISAHGEMQSEPAFIAWFNLSRCVLASNSLLDGDWQLGRALHWGRESIGAMRVLGSAFGEAAALFHLGNAYWLAGDFERSLSMLRSAVELAKQTGNRLVEHHAELLLAVAALRDGSRPAAMSTLTGLAASTNSQLSHAAATVLADSACRQGDYERAVGLALEAVRGRAMMYRRMARATLARAYLGRSDFEAALVATEQAFEEGEASAFPHLTVDLLGSRARALLGCGASHAAEETIRAACKFRDSVAQSFDEADGRMVFRTRGRANRTLDELAERVGE